jgi:hypothetical protein
MSRSCISHNCRRNANNYHYIRNTHTVLNLPTPIKKAAFSQSARQFMPKSQLYFCRRPVGQSVRCQAPFWDPWQLILFSFDLQAAACLLLWDSHSVERTDIERFCWASPAQSSGSSPAELSYILLSQNWDSPSLQGQISVFISNRKMVAQLYQVLGSSYLKKDGQSASLSSYQATIWETRPIFLSPHGNYLQTFAVF